MLSLPSLRHRRLRVAVAAAAATALAVAAFTSNGAQAGTQRPAPRLSAAQIADGVLFGNGPAARYLTGAELPRPQMNAAERALELRMNSMLVEDSGYSRAFATTMQSGNRVRISEALADLGARVLRLMKLQLGAAAFASQVTKAQTALGHMPLRDAMTHAAAMTTDQKSVVTDNVNINENENVNDFVNYDEAYVVVLVLLALFVVVISAPAAGTDSLTDQMLVNTIASDLKAA